MKPPRVVLCLPGGGVTGAMYQIGALAALEDSFDGLDTSRFDGYVGSGSGAAVAAAVAGGAPVQRLYRSFLDPADNYFPLHRHHLLRMDLDEWRRTLRSGWGALRHGTASLLARAPTAVPNDLWLELDRFVDSLPAGLFSLDGYERLLAEFFFRRGISNSFRTLPRSLRILAADLDTGERVAFGARGYEDVPVSLACSASLALPLFYSPVRVGDRHYLDAGLTAADCLEVALQAPVDLVIVIDPLVPVRIGSGAVPTGHGRRPSLRDKGALWVSNQAARCTAAARLDDCLARLGPTGEKVFLLQPNPSDATLFLHNPASFAHRRPILEYAYKATRERAMHWFQAHGEMGRRTGWALRGFSSPLSERVVVGGV